MCFRLINFAPVKAPMLATFLDLPVACMERGLLVLTNLVDHFEKVDVTHVLSLDQFCTGQSTDAFNLLGSACCLHGERIVGADKPCGSFREGGRHTCAFA